MTSQPNPASPPQSELDQAGSASILIVDDDPANRESLARRLQRRGYTVATAVDGSDALRQIEQSSYDLILLDVMMPGMSGLEVLKRLRQDHPPTVLPVIMATAKDQSEDVVTALELGASDYVTKPLDFPIVAARVRTQLSLKQSVAKVLELERQLQRRNAELESANEHLREAADRDRRELENAARVQLALLPTAAPGFPQLNCSWAFRPSQQLAGDALNLFRIDERTMGFYVLDVSGHGVAASLLAVAVTRALADAQDLLPSASNGSGAVAASPAEVIDRLSKSFSWIEQTGQFLTIFYAALDVPTRRLTYVSAGHPPALRLGRSGETSWMSSTATPMGVAESFTECSVQLDPGDRLYVYSDGVTESMNEAMEQFGHSRLGEVLAASRTAPLAKTLDDLLQKADEWRGSDQSRDDVSLLALECQS